MTSKGAINEVKIVSGSGRIFQDIMKKEEEQDGLIERERERVKNASAEESNAERL